MSNPGPNQTVTSNLTQENIPNNSDGHQVGSALTAYVGFFGATPGQQPTNAAQATIVDASGGSAAPTNGILTITATFVSTVVGNAIATIAAQTNAIQAALVTLGLIKGG